MPFAPLDLLSARSWRRVTFTTYALSLSFFEAVVLDALVRGSSRDVLILSDVAGVSMALGEQGARRVGKEYDLEPIAVSTGVFHPKLSVLTADDDWHVLIGSGNLTFGGWGGNLEAIEHLHPSFAADAIEDIVGFFERLAASDTINHGTGDRCRIIAEDLRVAVRARPRNGDIRVLHSLDGSISQKLVQIVDDLGGAVRLVAASPFWDGGAAIDDLCVAIGLQEVFVHAHVGGTVEGTTGSNWPLRAGSAIRPVRLEVMNEEKPRRLHAKVLEVLCKRGRVLLAGSANATAAALSASRNVEACVARIQREPAIGWKFSPCDAPVPIVRPDDEQENNLGNVGVLRAVLKGDQIVGQVLTPKMSGAISLFHLTTEGAEKLGDTKLAPDASFSLNVPHLEVQSWKYGRLVLQVRSDDNRRAEGFVSVFAFAEITRRAGAMAPRLFSLLAGTETPADVAAMMSWFHEDPRRLAGAMPIAVTGGPTDKETDPTRKTIAVNRLDASFAADKRGELEAAGGRSWRRFMEYVFSAFRERRGPFEEEDDENDDEKGGAENQQKRRRSEVAVVRTLDMCDKLFDIMILPKTVARQGMIALDLTQYICDRLRPDFDRARVWLERLIDAISRTAVPVDRRDEVAASIMVWLASRYEPDRAREARTWLLRLGYPIHAGAPSTELAQGFQSVLVPTAEFSDVWRQVQNVRTYAEQVRAYLLALRTGQRSTEYEELAKVAPNEWPSLQEALRSESSRSRLCVLEKLSTSCPRCHITLPTIEASKLRTIGIATAASCCRRTLLYPGA